MPPVPSPPRFSVGHIIDRRFRVIASIAEGGMGAVLRVFDAITSTAVALKYCMEPDDYTRFAREVRIAQQINHVNVMKVLHSNLAHDPPYFIMPLANHSLADELEAPWWTNEHAIDAFLSLCQGVAAIHAAKATHRDIKPLNALRMPDSSIAVSDLGLARFDDRDSTTLTATIAQMGTWDYMAPEQRNGDTKNADARTDVFQLGKVLYELFTKEPPTVMDLDLVPRGIRGIIVRATKRLPDDRYQHVSDMILDGEKYKAALSPTADPQGRLDALLAEAAQLLIDNRYKGDNIGSTLDMLEVLALADEQQKLIEYFDRVSPRVYTGMLKHHPEKLERVLQFYAEAQHQLGGGFDYSYAEGVANKMQFFVQAPSVPPGMRTAALRAMFLSSVRLNRFAAMESAARAIMSVQDGPTVALVLKMLEHHIDDLAAIASRIQPDQLHPDLLDVFNEARRRSNVK